MSVVERLVICVLLGGCVGVLGSVIWCLYHERITWVTYVINGVIAGVLGFLFMLATAYGHEPKRLSRQPSGLYKAVYDEPPVSPTPSATRTPAPTVLAACPPGWMPVTQPSGTNPNEFIAFGSLANGQTARYCGLLPQWAASLRVITADRSGVQQCTHVRLTISDPRGWEDTQSADFNNNFLGWFDVMAGPYLFQVDGLEPLDTPGPGSCTTNPFLLAWRWQ